MPRQSRLAPMRSRLCRCAHGLSDHEIQEKGLVVLRRFRMNRCCHSGINRGVRLLDRRSRVFQPALAATPCQGHAQAKTDQSQGFEPHCHHHHAFLDRLPRVRADTGVLTKSHTGPSPRMTRRVRQDQFAPCVAGKADLQWAIRPWPALSASGVPACVRLPATCRHSWFGCVRICRRTAPGRSRW